MLPIPLIAGFPGFKEKIWMVNMETAYWQGVYQWKSLKDLDEYKSSFVLHLMNKRAVKGSVSYKVLEDTTITDYLREQYRTM